MMSPQLPQGFGSVDGGEDPLAFVSYVDAVSALSSAQAYKQLTLLMLRVSEGNRVLDVGCGTGEDARALAQVVGPRGWVVGIDNSRTMIEEATRRQNGLGAPVEFYVGDACQIAFPDGVFDACRADRVFQHLREPRKALSEMIRVTRRGGRIVVSDPDWGTFIVNSPDRDLTHRIVGFACDATTDGWMGRQPGLFREVVYRSSGPLLSRGDRGVRHGEGGLGDRVAGARGRASRRDHARGGRALASRASGGSRRGPVHLRPRWLCRLGYQALGPGGSLRVRPGSVCHSGG